MRTISSADKVYAYDVVLAPNARGGLRKFIVWDTGGTPKYDQEAIIVPARTSVVGDQPFSVAITWPAGTTLGTVGYQIRYLSAGSWVSTAWLSAGVAATTGMDGSGAQSAGATIDGTFTPNEADGSTTAILVPRSHSSSPVYAPAIELNLQATSAAGATVALLKVMPALSGDSFAAAGYQARKNVAGTVTAVGSHITGASVVAIPEYANSYAARIAFDPAIAPFIEWDEDETIYMQDGLFFPLYVGVPVTPPPAPPADTSFANSPGRARDRPRRTVSGTGELVCGSAQIEAVAHISWDDHNELALALMLL